MEQNFFQQQKKQRNLVIILIAILAVTGLIFLFGFLQNDSAVPSEFESGGSIIQTKKIEMDFSVFENPILKVLLPFSAISPLNASSSLKIGKENPFLEPD